MSNVVVSLAEQSVISLLQPALVGTVCEGKIYTSDSDVQKEAGPNVVVRIKGAEEQISPGCGIYKLTIEIEFQSHVKDTTPNERDAVMTAINNFGYTSPATNMSTLDGFYCYGFIPAAGVLSIEPETKSYVYLVESTALCMARDNT
jgi:hypothetical protein